MRSRIKLSKPSSIDEAELAILESARFCRSRFGVADWYGSRRVAGAYMLRAAQRLVDDCRAEIIEKTPNTMFIRILDLQELPE